MNAVVRILVGTILYVVICSITRYLSNGDLGAMLGVVAASILSISIRVVRFARPMGIATVAIILGAGIVFSWGRMTNDIGRGEDSVTYWLMIGTYWFGAFLVLAISVLARTVWLQAMKRRKQ